MGKSGDGNKVVRATPGELRITDRLKTKRRPGLPNRGKSRLPDSPLDRQEEVRRNKQFRP